MSSSDSIMPASPLRLALVCFSTAWGGLEMKLVEIAFELSKRRHYVCIVAPKQSPIIQESQKKGLQYEEVSPRFKYFDLFAANQLKNVISQHAVDLLIAGQSKDVSTVLFAAKMARRGKLIFIQQMQFDHPKKDLFHRWTYGGIARWLTLTHQMRESVLRNTIINPKDVIVFPLGLNLTDFNPSRYSLKQTRRELGLPTDSFILAVIGRLDPQKGQEFFIRAIPQVLAHNAKAYFLIIGQETQGEEGYAKRLRDLVSQFGVQNVTRFLPHTNNVPHLLSAIDVLILPSISETFGYVLIEAMAMGKPVIATSAGGVPEIVTEGETGLLIPPRNSDALSKAILKLAGDQDNYMRISRAARNAAVERFDLQNQMIKLETILHEVLEEN